MEQRLELPKILQAFAESISDHDNVLTWSWRRQRRIGARGDRSDQQEQQRRGETE
jgi:hypothetical protein